MTRSQMIETVARKTGFTEAQVETTMDALFDQIADCLRADEKVTIAGFGRFEMRPRKPKAYRGVRAFGFSEPRGGRGRCAGARRCSCDYLPQEAQEPPPAGIPSLASAAGTVPNSFAACSRCGRRPSERAFRITSRTTVDAEVDSWAQSCMNASRSSIERRTLRTVDLTVMVVVFSETSLWGHHRS